MSVDWGSVGAIASPLIVGSGMVIQGILLMRTRAQEKGKIETQLQLRDDSLAAEIKRQAEATNKLEDSIREMSAQYREHETECAIFRQKTVDALDGMKDALKAVAENVTAVALINQQLQTHERAIARGLEQFQQVNRRFEETTRAIYALHRGQELPKTFTGVLGDLMEEPPLARRRGKNG